MAVTDLHHQPAARRRGIGPIGTTARLLVGLGLLGSVTWGHLARGFHPWSWALGLLGRDDQIGCALFWPIDHREHH